MVTMLNLPCDSKYWCVLSIFTETICFYGYCILIHALPLCFTGFFFFHFQHLHLINVFLLCVSNWSVEILECSFCLSIQFRCLLLKGKLSISFFVQQHALITLLLFSMAQCCERFLLTSTTKIKLCFYLLQSITPKSHLHQRLPTANFNSTLQIHVCTYTCTSSQDAAHTVQYVITTSIQHKHPCLQDVFMYSCLYIYIIFMTCTTYSARTRDASMNLHTVSIIL